MQELCQCLAPLLEGGDLLNLEMLDVAKNDLVAPASASASPTPEPKQEEQINLQVSKDPCASEPEEAAHLMGGLDQYHQGLTAHMQTKFIQGWQVVFP